jgi:hypothetical protein
MEHKLIDGKVVYLTPQEILERNNAAVVWQQGAFNRAMSALRSKRNQLLKDCDYTILQDSVLTPAKKSEWMTYRTNLRNITQSLTTVEQVNAVIFPAPPQK